MDPRNYVPSEPSHVLGTASLTQALHQTHRLRFPSLFHPHPNLPQRVLVRRLHRKHHLQRRVPTRIQDPRAGLRVPRDWDHRVDPRGELAPRGTHRQHNRGCL